MDTGAIIIGTGVAGIAMAHTLKWKLGYTDFEIYDKSDDIGGTWRANTYPGCGSDVPVHLYSFSFNQNPDWTNALADQKEILTYIESTVDKFQLRPYMRFKHECLGAKWNGSMWEVTLLDLSTNKTITRRCKILLTAVGGFSRPRRVNFPGMDQFQGKIFHTAEWDATFEWKDKKVAVIGNGCSAAQVVPAIAPDVRKLTQYARSSQWYHERPNKAFTAFEKFCFRYVPLWQRYNRLRLFLQTDELASVYGPTKEQVRQREALEDAAKAYIFKETPKKYHSFIAPDFPLGCKRRIYDPGYLESLHNDNVDLLPEGIQSFTETGIISETGKEEKFDAIILATGFQVSSFLTPMEIIGKNGRSLHDQWSADQGAQAYMGTFVHNHPNFAMLFGPNTFPAFNSVIFPVEVQVAYIANSLIKPVFDGYTDVLEVKKDAEDRSVKELDKILGETVFAAGCSNWYINSAGRNSAAWPGLASTFWKATYFTKWSDFEMEGGTKAWFARKLRRKLQQNSTIMLALAATAAALSLVVNPQVLLMKSQ